MKKIYESPVAEVTVLESKDNILASVEPDAVLNFSGFFASTTGDLVDAANENLF